MKTFKKDLTEKNKNKKFKEVFEAEKELLSIALKISKYREEKGITQKELALKARITQQQLSKVENGINCNMITFLKVCEALDIKLALNREIKRKMVA